VRYNAYTGLINLAEFRYGVDSIIDVGIFPVLIDKLAIENEEPILILAL